MQKNIRSPIIVVIGHTDHGKTTLLDKIRGTTVTETEAGKITQHTGASYVPSKIIKKISGQLLNKFKIKIEIPGLLFIDVPGHKAFFGMRKRGGSVSDLAILVVDSNKGFQEQTYESLKILKDFKTPFIVVITKIDRIRGWYPIKNSSFLESFNNQKDDVKTELEKSLYNIVSQLSENDIEAERYDRITDFKKQVAIVPISSNTGEGISDILMVLSGLAQQFLKDKIKITKENKGSVLEVKNFKGLGTTIDVILYNGKIKKGYYTIIGGIEPIVTKIKAILSPRKLQELRNEKQFEYVDEIYAAAGVKISAPNLENVISGSPIIFVPNEEDIEKAKKEIQKEVESIKFEKDFNGVVIKTDTLGSLEAMIKILNDEKIPIKKASIGDVNKQDVIEAHNINNKSRSVILAFHTNVSEEIKLFSKDMKIKLFENKIIYRLLENYQKWIEELNNNILKEKQNIVVHPCEVKVLKGTIFRQSNPAVFGVEILRGVIKPGVVLARDGKRIDRVKGIEKEGKNVYDAIRGDKVALSMEKIIIGKHLNEGDVMKAIISPNNMKILKDIYNRLKEDEKELLKEDENF